MADLSFIDKRRLEACFGMGSGYVLDFSNDTFQEFVRDTTGLDIYASKYDRASGSKANRLRAFFTKEQSHTVGTLITGLLEYLAMNIDVSRDRDYEVCTLIAERLRQSPAVQDAEAIFAIDDERGFELLAKSVRESIEHDELEAGLDRLHTFAVKYLRAVCERHGIDAPRGKPLHSLVGEYARKMREEGKIDSRMAARALRYSIRLLDDFNDVRNEQSLAHDNPLLGYDEARLIFNQVCSTIRYIRAIEDRVAEPEAPLYTLDDIPF